MRPFQRMLKVIKISAISLSLLPLTTFAQCFTPLEQGPIDNFVTSISYVLQQGDRKEVAQQCMADNTRPIPEDAAPESYADVPRMPQDFEASCNCLEMNSTRPSAEEVKVAHQRLKELKHKDRKLREYRNLRQVAEVALEAFLSLKPDGDLPSECQNLLGPESKLEGGPACRTDLEKIVNTKLKVEPYILNPHSEDFKEDVNRIISKNRRNRGPRNEVALSDEYLGYNALRRRFLNENRPQDSDGRERRSSEIFNVGGKEVLSMFIDGMDANAIQAKRSLQEQRLRVANEELAKASLPFNEDAMIPFSPSEVDRKAIELLVGPINYSVELFNNQVEEALAEGKTVFTDPQNNNEIDKLNDVVKLFEANTGHTAGVPETPLIPPFGLTQRNTFEPKDDFERAVARRYRQMANLFNDTLTLKASLEQLYNFEADGKTLTVEDQLSQNLLRLAVSAYKSVESADHLTRSCKNALEKRVSICQPITDAELDEIQLDANDINLYAAADLKSGQEAEYGMITCGSYIDWKEQNTHLVTGTLVSSGFDDYTRAGCDVSAEAPGPVSRFVSWATGGAYGTGPCVPMKEVEVAKASDIHSDDLAARAASLAASAAAEGAANARKTVVLTDTSTMVDALPSSKAQVNSEYSHMLPSSDNTMSTASSEREIYGPVLPVGYKVKSAPTPGAFNTDYAIKVDSNVTPSTFGFDSSSNMGESSARSAGSFTGGIDADAVSPDNSFNMNNLFQPVVSDGSRFSIYDNDVSALASNQTTESESVRPMTEAQVAGAERALASTDSRYNALMSEFEKLQAEMEELKGAKEEEETAELLGDLKEQIAELKGSRQELEERIKREKAQREQELKAAELAESRQNRNGVRESIFRRDDSSGARPAARPTYDANEGGSAPVARIQAPVSGIQSVVSNGANVSGNSTRRNDDVAARASEMSAGVLAPSQAGTNSAAMANVEGLRLTATAFSKLSSNDLQTLYETNKGQPIYVERQLADGDGSHETVIEKYVPELIEGEVVYSFQGEVGAEEEALATPEEKATSPGRAIASVEAPEEIAQDAAPLRTIKEVTNYEETLYSPVHQELIERIRKAVAEQRQQ